MTPDDLKPILDLVQAHDLAELELEDGTFRLRVKRGGPHVVTHVVPAAAAAPAAAAGRSASAGAAGRPAGRGRRAGHRQVADRRHLLPRRRAGRAGVRVGRRPGQEGPGALHHRGDEADERDRQRVRRRSRQHLRGERPAGAVRRADLRHPAEALAAMFKKILVANRGEIALRVIFACRELGIKTVAVYSEADENSLHVRFADEDICIGAGPQRRQLPERAGDHQRRRDHRRRRHPSRLRLPLRERLPGRGLRGLPHPLHRPRPARHPPARRQGQGPPGDEEGRLPMLPGSDGPVENEDRALQLAKDIGYPVIVKAVAGGGGRGMRIVKTAGRAGRTPCGPPSARPRPPSATATSTSRRYLEAPRHIEFQILGDHHGIGRAPGRARVLDPAAAPEAARGVAVAGAHRQGAPQDGRAGRRRRPGGAVHQRRHLRVPDGREGPLLLHGSEHPRAGRAPGHRVGHRASTSSRSRSGSPPASGCRSGRAT